MKVESVTFGASPEGENLGIGESTLGYHGKLWATPQTGIRLLMRLAFLRDGNVLGCLPG